MVVGGTYVDADPNDVPDEGQVDDVDVYQVYVEYVPDPPVGFAVSVPAVAP